MSNGLHLELDKKQIPGSTFSQGVLTLEKAGKFTVQIKEYQELLNRKLKLDLTKGRTLVDSITEKESEEIKTSLAKFETVNWAWSTVYEYGKTSHDRNLFVEKGIDFNGKSFSFPKVLEGGGFCYVEAFFEGESATSMIPNGILVQAIGTPRIVRVEWTDREYNPIKDTKIAYGSHVLLHIYTEGLYGQEILVGLSNKTRQHAKLKINGGDFFEVEVKSYPLRPFEEKNTGVSGLLVKTDTPKQADTSIQKAIVEVAVEFAWMFDQTPIEYLGAFTNDMDVCTDVLQKTTGNSLPVPSDGNELNVSTRNAKKMDFDKDTTNKPVVVGEIDTVFKTKNPINFTFGVFIDGTLNNMYNTEMKQKMDSQLPHKDGTPKKEAPINTTGLDKNMRLEDMQDIYEDFGDPDHSESSYENDLSNPAILFKNYTADFESVFKIYTEGVGTHSAPKRPEETKENPNPMRNTQLGKDDYQDDDEMEGPAFGAGNAGIRDKVRQSIVDVVDKIRNSMKGKKDMYIDTITFDVFGFSRGAAAARHFVHVVKYPSYRAKTGWLVNFQHATYTTYDMQGTPLPSSYKGKAMPEFGVLGQLLEDAGLLAPQTKVNVRFVGVYDTVPHHGLSQSDDFEVLGLDDVDKADYVVHMVAADEYRAYFDLVDISSVTKTHPDSKKKGGMELIYPGVHCDVGGAYVEGDGNHPRRINVAQKREPLEAEKRDFVEQGWFREEEMFIKSYLTGLVFPTPFSKFLRLEGEKTKVSNQYSYIPLHLMAQFCDKKEVPIKESKILKGYDFKDNKKELGIEGTVGFLNTIKKNLEAYSFEGGPALVYHEEKLKPEIDPLTGKLDEKNIQHNIKERSKNYYIRHLRYHYLHWNATYGDPKEAKGTWLSGKNHPNMDKNNKRKRNVH